MQGLQSASRPASVMPASLLVVAGQACRHSEDVLAAVQCHVRLLMLGKWAGKQCAAQANSQVLDRMDVADSSTNSSGCGEAAPLQQ